MSMKKLNQLLKEGGKPKLVTIIACPTDCLDEDQFDVFENRLKELGFIQSDVQYVYLKNQTDRRDKVWQVIEDERAKQETLMEPSVFIEFASSDSIDQLEFNGASEANCLSYYADEQLLALAKQVGAAILI